MDSNTSVSPVINGLMRIVEFLRFDYIFSRKQSEVRKVRHQRSAGVTQLPLELRLKILSYLSGDYKTLGALQRVFPKDLLIKQLLQFKQLIFFGSDQLHPDDLKLIALPSENVHRLDKILVKKELYFRFPVDQLWFFMYPNTSMGDEEEALSFCALMIKEPNLLRARVLKLDGYTTLLQSPEFSDMIYRIKRISVLHKVVLFDIVKSNGVPNISPRFFKLEELIIKDSALVEVYLLVNLKKLELSVSWGCDLNNLNKLCGLRELCLNIHHTLEGQLMLTIRLKLMKLERLTLRTSCACIEDNFDECSPNLKFLDLSNIILLKLPKLARTTLEELHLNVEDFSVEDDLFEDDLFEVNGFFKNILTLVNLKKLSIESDLVEIYGLSLLSNLEYLKLTSRFLASVELDGNLRVLSMNGFELLWIRKLPAKLQELKFSDMIELYIDELNIEL